jgi:hypothetical protein
MLPLVIFYCLYSVISTACRGCLTVQGRCCRIFPLACEQLVVGLVVAFLLTRRGVIVGIS